MANGRRWTHDELLVALNLYHKLTFGQMDRRQPAVIAIAEKLGRTASSLAMKLCNFASFDPALQLRGIKGLPGASAQDRTVWNDFHSNLNETVPATENALRDLFGVDEADTLEVLPGEGVRVLRSPPNAPTERTVSIQQRRGQAYFRNAVLNNFGGRCSSRNIIPIPSELFKIPDGRSSNNQLWFYRLDKGHGLHGRSKGAK